MTRPDTSGFSPVWLALREPVDRAARDPGVLSACVRALAGRPRLAVCDLGAGTGAALRALAPLLPGRQAWTLVDSDAANLDLARGPPGAEIRRLRLDLAHLANPWPAGSDLVTASAFFDLASPAWIARLVLALAAERLPLLATLTYDGTLRFDPAHPLDGVLLAAFNRHQRRDKGFGPAAGPAAQALLRRELEAAGYRVVEGASPWRLGPASRLLLDAFLDGLVAAVLETGELAPADLTLWRRQRMAPELTATVGHRDLFAHPA